MKTVLLIEDNTLFREITIEILEMGGYKVIAFTNGKMGLYSVKQNKPDLILCDILMPEVNGYEVLKGLQNDTDTSMIPFVFLTASSENKEIEYGLSMGANGYIRKPFEPKELFSTIERCLGGESISPYCESDTSLHQIESLG